MINQNKKVADIKQHKFPYSVNVVYRCSLHNHRHLTDVTLFLLLSTLIPKILSLPSALFIQMFLSAIVNWDYVLHNDICLRFPSDFTLTAETNNGYRCLTQYKLITQRQNTQGTESQ